MKEKTKSVVLLFFISLIFIPSFIYGASTYKNNQLQVATAQKVLDKLTVSPTEVKLPCNANEAMLKEKIEVSVSYKKEKTPQVIKDYQTDFDHLKVRKGTQKVNISYTENGCTKKAKVCVIFVPCQSETTNEEDINFPYISGYPDKTFKPDQAVTREELATMLARLITKNQIPSENNIYKDLYAGRFSTDAINYMTKLGIMKPIARDTFEPFGKVTDNEFKEIIGRAEKYIRDKNVVLPSGNSKLTRAEAVVALNKLFNVQCNTNYKSSPFTDVKETDKDYAAIVCATQNRN